MKKLIKDEIYHCEFHLIVCPLDKINQALKSHYKRQGETYHNTTFEDDADGYTIRVENEKGYVDRFLWLSDETLKKGWKETVLTLTHELNHVVDRVFDRIQMEQTIGNGETTEARAYYFEYLLRQVLKYLYK